MQIDVLGTNYDSESSISTCRLMSNTEFGVVDAPKSQYFHTENNNFGMVLGV